MKLEMYCWLQLDQETKTREYREKKTREYREKHKKAHPYQYYLEKQLTGIRLMSEIL